MNKRIVVIILLTITLGLIGAAVYIGYKLSSTNVPADDASARAFQSCSTFVKLLNCVGSNCTDYTNNPTAVFDSKNNCLWVDNRATILSGNHWGCPDNLSSDGGCQEERIAGIPPGGNGRAYSFNSAQGRLYCYSRTTSGYCAEQMDINVQGQSGRCQVSYIDNSNCGGSGPTSTPVPTTPPGSCRCTGGFDCNGNPIDPNTTSCGMTVCGRDFQQYVCSQSGWTPNGVSCNGSCTVITPTPPLGGCPATITVFVVDGTVRAANSNYSAPLPVNAVQVAASTNGGNSFNNFNGELIVSGSHNGTYSGNTTTNIPGPFTAQSNYTLQARYNGQICATSSLSFTGSPPTSTPTIPVNTPTPTTVISVTPTPTTPVNTPTPTTPVNSPTPTPTTPVNSPTPTTVISVTPTPTIPGQTPTGTPPISITPPVTTTVRPTVPPNCGTPCNNGLCDNGLFCHPQTNRCVMYDCYNNPNQCGPDMCSLLPITAVEGGRINKLVIGIMFMMFGITLYFLNIHTIIADKFSNFAFRK